MDLISYARILPHGVGQIRSEPSNRQTAKHQKHANRKKLGDLISVTQFSTPSSQPSTAYYGYDGHGSVHFLTDSDSGAATDITDTYEVNPHAVRPLPARFRTCAAR